LYQFHDLSVATGGGTSALRVDRPLARVPDSPARRGEEPKILRFPTLDRPRPSTITVDHRQGLKERLANLQLVTDLGRDIGSRQWLRGFALCAGLCYAAYSFAPGIDPFIGRAPAPLADAQWEESRSLAIAPLAYGADTGRRMAATDIVQPLTDTPERPTVELLAALGRGDGFARALERVGVSRADAKEVADMVSQVTSVNEISPGSPAKIVLGRRPNKKVARPLDLLSFRAAFDLKLEVKRIGGLLVLNRIPIAVDNTPLRIQGRVGSSLYRAARAAGAPGKAVESYIRALATQIEIGSVGADDRFDIIVEHKRAATGETETGQLLYAGLDRSRGKDLRMMQWDQGGRMQWFEASGVGKSSGLLQRPVPGTVSSKFGMRRHPILRYSRMHKGMDFRAGYGTPILAAADGRVVRAGWAGGYGKQVRLNHAGGLSTSYAHMSRIVAQPGQMVRQGQLIGYVGSTGLSTGPHLHYEVYLNGKAVNPASTKFTAMAQLSKSQLAAFRNKLRSLLAVPAGSPMRSDVRSAQAQTAPKPDRG
jgi:murein DD-endopeptidase MepM/ murein hydrolase activator NlpD